MDAEAIRVALHDKGIPFVDKSFEGDEWGKFKPDGLKANLTAAGKLAFGQVPLLEIDGLSLVQSMAILRYLGRTIGGWYKGSAAALAKIDMIADATEDVRKKLGAIVYAEVSDEVKALNLVSKYLAEPTEALLWLGYLDKYVAKSSTGFAASSPDATHADYLLLDLLDYHEHLVKFYKCSPEKLDEVMKKLPALRKWRKMMVARPKLKAYLEGPDRR